MLIAPVVGYTGTTSFRFHVRHAITLIFTQTIILYALNITLNSNFAILNNVFVVVFTNRVKNHSTFLKRSLRDK